MTIQLIAVSFVAVAFTATPTSAGQPTACEAEVRAAATAWADAIRAGDGVTVGQTYAPAARLYVPNTAIVSGEAVPAFWRKLLPSNRFEWGPQDIVVAASCDLAYSRATYTWWRPDTGKGETIERGKFLVVWQRGTDKQWRITDDIWNAGQ